MMIICGLVVRIVVPAELRRFHVGLLLVSDDELGPDALTSPSHIVSSRNNDVFLMAGLYDCMTVCVSCVM